MTSEGGNEAPLLLADVGATGTRFALTTDAGRTLTGERLLASADFAGLVEAVRCYYDEAGITADTAPRRAAIAIATPVIGDTVAMTNHHWSFSIAATRQSLGLDRLLVLNDFTALAMALPVLPRSARSQVGGGTPVPDAPLALIGPGSGLGVSGLVPSGGAWAALASEGGHASFSPADTREAEILCVAQRKFGHVSTERLVSGMGLVNLHTAIAELSGEPVAALSPAEITAKGIAGTCPLCAETVAVFCAMLGTAAGNLALTLGARGGVYIGGGIVPKLGDYFAASAFRSRFEEKGRFAAYLAAIPTYVIHSGNAALHGAAQALIALVPDH